MGAAVAVQPHSPLPNPLPPGERERMLSPTRLNRTLMVMAGGTGGHV